MPKRDREEPGDDEGQRLFEQAIDRMMSTPPTPRHTPASPRKHRQAARGDRSSVPKDADAPDAGNRSDDASWWAVPSPLPMGAPRGLRTNASEPSPEQ